MAEQQTIKYAPQWNNMTVNNMTFQTNNVVGNFNYPPNVPAYKPIMKFLLNCHLNKAFTNYPSVVYQNFLKEFWSTTVAYDPFSSTDETKQRPLREFLIKFLVLNRQRPLTIDFNTFCSSTGLDYNNGKYVAHLTPEAVQKELGKIAINPSYLDKTLVLKNSFPVAWRILFIFVIQVDIGEIIYNDLVTKLLNKSRLKYISYPRFISCALQVLLGSDYTQDENFGFLPGILRNSNFTKDPSKVTSIELTAHMIAINNRRDSVSPLPLFAKPKKGKSHTVTLTLPKSQGPEASGALSKKRQNPKSKNLPTETKVIPPKPTEGSEQSHSVSSGTVPDPQDLERNIQLASTGLPSTLDEGTRKSQPLPEGPATHPKNSRGNIQPLDRDLTSMTCDEGTIKTMSCLEGSLRDKDLGGNKPPANMEPINPTVADPSGTSAKYQVDQTQSTRLRYQSMTENKTSDTDSSCDDILKKYDNTLPLTKRQLVKYLRKVSTVLLDKITEDSREKHQEAAVNYANLKASIDDYYDEKIAHRDQTDKLAHALKQDEKLAAWGKSSTNMAWNLGSRLLGQSSGSVTPTLALTHIPANVEGENDTNTATEDPPSHTKGETDANKQEKSEEPRHSTDANIEFIGPSNHKNKANARMDKEEQIKKAKEEARLFSISKPEVIKVVREEAKKLGIHLKEVITTKAGEKFKKAQDAEHEVLKRQHTEKVRKSLELRKHKFENYMWTISSRLKPETITDIKIHLKTKPIVITVFRGIDDRNFDVHKPFAFGEFGISELDKLGEIIPKKKNAVVQDLMNSLSQRYERIRKMPEELGIKLALSAPTSAPEQASSKSSRKKRKHMELEPEIKIPGLECNRALPENVPFFNNMVIEEPEHGIFFTDEFGDQAFQRGSDIDKVGMEALVSYLVAASMVKLPENARFNMKLKKLIVEHPDQEKLKSKKVKLEALRYEMN
ncbi:hypothetical protein Tco_1293418 [Tanacetum coccineum]